MDDDDDDMPSLEPQTGPKFVGIQFCVEWEEQSHCVILLTIYITYKSLKSQDNLQ